MFGWLKRQLDTSTANSIRIEFERYLNYLRGIDADEMASLLVATAITRRFIRKQAGRGDQTFRKIESLLETGCISEETAFAPFLVNRLRASAQKNGAPMLVGGYTVLLNVVRCYSHPEVRHLGKQMWAELQRGTPHLRAALDDLDHFMDEKVSLADCEWIPHGLNPIEESNHSERVKQSKPLGPPATASPAIGASPSAPAAKSTRSSAESEVEDAMSRILSNRSISLEGPEDQGRPFREVVTLAAWIGAEAVSRSGLKVATLDDDDRFIALLFTFVASDHLSRLAGVEFETSSVLACMSLSRRLGALTAPVVFGDLIATHTGMAKSPNRAKVLQAIGRQVALFFSTDADEYLAKLGELFLIVRRRLEPTAQVSI